MAFQKGKRKFKKIKRGKLQQPCRILVSPVNGTISFKAPFNEDFHKEFLATVDHKRRQWDGDKGLWRTVPELLTVVVELAQKHYSKIEGLEEIYQNDYDIIGIHQDMPMVVVRAAVKALRIAYAPDKIHHTGDYKDIFPGAANVTIAREMATDKLQEISDALGRIELERGE